MFTRCCCTQQVLEIIFPHLFFCRTRRKNVSVETIGNRRRGHDDKRVLLLFCLLILERFNNNNRFYFFHPKFRTRILSNMYLGSTVDEFTRHLTEEKKLIERSICFSVMLYPLFVFYCRRFRVIIIKIVYACRFAFTNKKIAPHCPRFIVVVVVIVTLCTVVI